MAIDPSFRQISDDLLDFVASAPSPFHCVEAARVRLEADGFARLDERAAWDLEPGAGYYVVRGGGSIAAFRLGTELPAVRGFRIVGAHTDSPNLRLKPRPARAQDTYLRADVEMYGGAIFATWADRDLGLAGRLVVEDSGGLRERLVCIDRPIARIPTVAIHLDRKVNEEGLKLDRHKDAGPVLALDAGAEGSAARLMEAVARAADVAPDAIRGHDLCLYDLQPGTVAGLEEEFLLSARLDNQAMCHAGLAALVASDAPTEATPVLALFDHEEVGSRSARGALGPLLRDVLGRVAGPDADAWARAAAHSFLVSADMAHAVHPSKGDLHDGEHLPVLNGGPVVKTHVAQRYATDAHTGAIFRGLCRAADVPVQEFVVRQDLPCGSTIGPLSAAGLGIPTVDVGNPMLSMHSVREMAGAHDPARMVRVLARFYAAPRLDSPATS